MKIKKYLVGAGLGVAILTGVASMALAQNPSNSNSGAKHPPMVIEINPSGKALLRGTVKVVGADSLTLTSWGGDWQVNTSNARFLPSGDLSQISMGDFVGIQGSVDQNVTWGINAILVRNWTEKMTIRNIRNEIKEIMRAETPKNWQGKVSNINATNKSFTLTINDINYTINVTDTAKIVNRNYSTISFTDIKNGDTVRVWGPSSETTITASVVRDISI